MTLRPCRTASREEAGAAPQRQMVGEVLSRQDPGGRIFDCSQRGHPFSHDLRHLSGGKAHMYFLEVTVLNLRALILTGASVFV